MMAHLAGAGTILGVCSLVPFQLDMTSVAERQM